MTDIINRRKALATVAAIPAAVAFAAPTVAAAPGEDAELLRLFEEWKAQNLRCKETVQRFEEVRAKVMEGLGPCWELVGVKGEPCRAVFISSRHNDATQKIVPLKVRSFLDARNEALKIQASLSAERQERERAAERKHKSASVEREYKASFKRRRQLEDQIAETPAEGLTGIAIKLALCTNEEDFMQEPAVTFRQNSQRDDCATGRH